MGQSRSKEKWRWNQWRLTDAKWRSSQGGDRIVRQWMWQNNARQALWKLYLRQERALRGHHHSWLTWERPSWVKLWKVLLRRCFQMRRVSFPRQASFWSRWQSQTTSCRHCQRQRWCRQSPSSSCHYNADRHQQSSSRIVTPFQSICLMKLIKFASKT